MRLSHYLNHLDSAPGGHPAREYKPNRHHIGYIPGAPVPCPASYPLVTRMTYTPPVAMLRRVCALTAARPPAGTVVIAYDLRGRRDTATVTGVDTIWEAVRALVVDLAADGVRPCEITRVIARHGLVTACIPTGDVRFTSWDQRDGATVLR